MHAYIIIRGVKHLSDLYISQLQGKFTTYEVKEGTKNKPKGIYNRPLQVNPIQLVEVVFPKEHKDIVLTTLLGKKESQYPQLPMAMGMLRKMLGISKIPDYNDATQFPVNKDFLQILGVGIKDDENFEDGTEAL